MIILACLLFAALLTGAVVHIGSCTATLAKSKDAKKGDQP